MNPLFVQDLAHLIAREAVENGAARRRAAAVRKAPGRRLAGRVVSAARRIPRVVVGQIPK